MLCYSPHIRMVLSLIETSFIVMFHNVGVCQNYCYPVKCSSHNRVNVNKPIVAHTVQLRLDSTHTLKSTSVGKGLHHMSSSATAEQDQYGHNWPS